MTAIVQKTRLAYSAHKQLQEAPIVSLKQVTVKQKKQIILDSITFDLHKGEFMYLVGRTGTGKTSLLRTMYKDLPLGGGQLTVAGEVIGDLKTDEIPRLRRKLGIIFQDFHLLQDRSVDENLRFVLLATDWTSTQAMNKRIELVLKSVGLLHKRHVLPCHLSGGEQQRVVIARALLNDPVLILADEPTGNLDPETSEEIFSLLKTIAAETDTAVIVGTHDFYTISRFPARTAVCKEGTIKVGPRQEKYTY